MWGDSGVDCGGFVWADSGGDLWHCGGSILRILFGGFQCSMAGCTGKGSCHFGSGERLGVEKTKSICGLVRRTEGCEFCPVHFSHTLWQCEAVGHSWGSITTSQISFGYLLFWGLAAYPQKTLVCHVAVRDRGS